MRSLVLIERLQLRHLPRHSHLARLPWCVTAPDGDTYTIIAAFACEGDAHQWARDRAFSLSVSFDGRV